MQSSLSTQSISVLGLTPLLPTVSGQGDMLPAGEASVERQESRNQNANKCISEMSSILKVRFLIYGLRTCCIVDYPVPLVRNNYIW
eukprot:scaffold109358_cov22-Prasinocladus_malaysianus.AAC.2